MGLPLPSPPNWSIIMALTAQAYCAKCASLAESIERNAL